MIDLDGDCLSDLFLTVKDVSTGTYFYEIYLRRERATLAEQTDPETSETLSGMNSFCLVAREEIAAGSMFQFADIDRDGMMDMIYSNGLQLNVHYNRLQNELKLYQQSSEGIHLFKAKGICASTVRAVNLIKDMFTPPNKASKDPGTV